MFGRPPRTEDAMIRTLERRKSIRSDMFDLGIFNREELAKRNNCSSVTIWRDIKYIMKKIREEMDNGPDLVNRIHLQYEAVYRKASIEWEESRKDESKVKVQYEPKTCPACDGNEVDEFGSTCKRCGGKGVIKIKTLTKERKGRNGDPRYLEILLATLKEISKIRGLYPDKSVTNINMGTNINLPDLSKASNEEMLEIISRVDAITKRSDEDDPIDVKSEPIDVKVIQEDQEERSDRPRANRRRRT